MTNELMRILFIVCPMVFVGGFIDSVAGGGGLLSVPAYLFAGLPIHIAYGTNKFSGACGTVMAVGKYMKSGYINLRLALVSAGGAVVGSWFGAQLVLVASPKFLQICLMIILPLVAAFLLFNRNFGKENANAVVKTYTKTVLGVRAVLIGLVLGAYDGFFGPGTGTFLVIAFTALMGLPLTTATGNAKVVNLSSNIAALTAYILGGSVMFSVAIPAALCSILGNRLGASMAVKNGAKFIRPVVLFSVGLLLVNILSDFIQ